MSWGNLFDASGSFTGEETYGGTKRPSYQHDGNQTFKKPRGGASGARGGSWDQGDDISGPSSWDDMGAFGGGGGDDYGSGGGDDYGSGGGGDFGGLSEITSWDQISSGVNKKGGDSWKSGSASSRGSGQFGGNSSGAGNFRNTKSNQFGGNNDSNDDDGWGFGDSSGNSGGWTNTGRLGGGNKGFGGGGGGGGGRFGGGGGDKFGGGGGGNKFGGGGGGKFGGGGGGGGNRGGGRGGRGGGGYGGRSGGGDRRGGGGGFGNNADLPLVDKFKRYIDFLKNDKVQRQNSIQSMENACMSTNLNLKTNFFCEELPRIYNRQVYSARVSINGIFLARGVGGNKKELKHEVFNKAHEILLKSSTDDINNLKDPGIEMVRASIEKYLKCSAPNKFQEGHGTPLYKSMSEIMEEITKNLKTITILCTGLKKLTAYLKGPTPLPDNPISMLEQAMIASKCGLQHMFKSETSNDDDAIVFEGCFILEDTPIARSHNISKKVCKQEAYSAAIEALLNKSVNDLVIPVEKDKLEPEEEEQEHVKNEAIVAGVAQPDGEAPPPITKPSLRDAPLLDRVKDMINTLCSTAFTENNILVVDNCANNSGLSAMCIFRRVQVTSEECGYCDFFIDNVFVSTGIGSSKSDCMIDAYSNAWEILTTTSPEDLLAHHRRLTPNEKTDPFVLDCVVKGGLIANMESNVQSLIRHGFDPDDPSKSMKDLVICETANWQLDRKGSAFCILQHSATLSGLLLQWTFTTLKPTTTRNYKNEMKPMCKTQCVLFMKGNKMAEHSGFGRNKVRNFCASDILYRLYETQDVIRICKVNPNETCVKYSQIEVEADKLRRMAGEPKLEPITDLLQERKMDSFIVKAVCKRIDAFFPNKNGDDLIIGPGVKDLEMRQVHSHVLLKQLMFNLLQYEGRTFLQIMSRVDMKNIVQNLNALGGSKEYGKYKLVPKTSCPKHSDLNIKI